jgi:hypothetical protein
MLFGVCRMLFLPPLLNTACCAPILFNAMILLGGHKGRLSKSGKTLIDSTKKALNQNHFSCQHEKVGEWWNSFGMFLFSFLSELIAH